LELEGREDRAPGVCSPVEVESAYLSQFEPKQVGDLNHVEYWVPAEQLAEFNGKIVGPIAVVAEFRAGQPA
jgi:hypothetical protein